MDNSRKLVQVTREALASSKELYFLNTYNRPKCSCTFLAKFLGLPGDFLPVQVSTGNSGSCGQQPVRIGQKTDARAVWKLQLFSADGPYPELRQFQDAVLGLWIRVPCSKFFTFGALNRLQPPAFNIDRFLALQKQNEEIVDQLEAAEDIELGYEEAPGRVGSGGGSLEAMDARALARGTEAVLRSPEKKRSRYSASGGDACVAAGIRAREAAVAVFLKSWTKAETRLGGGEGLAGLYGTIGSKGTMDVLRSLVEYTDLGPASRFLDCFGGTGRPGAAAALYARTASVHMIEFDHIKTTKAASLLHGFTSAFTNKRPELAGDHALPSNLHIVCGDVLNVESLDELGAPTHAYAFWEAVDAKARQAFGKLITKSTTIKAVALVQGGQGVGQDAAQYMSDTWCMEGLRLLSSFAVTAVGGKRFQAYIFGKG